MFPAMVMAGDRPPVTVERTDNETIATELGESSFSRTGVLFGTASADRLMTLCIYMGSRPGIWNPRINTLTIGGVSATRRARVEIDEHGEISIWTAPVPTGTSGTVALTTTDLNNTINFHIFAVRGPVTNIFTFTSGGPLLDLSTAGSFDLSQATATNAALVGMLCMHYGGNNQNGSTPSWSAGLGDSLTTTITRDSGGGLQRLRVCSAYESALAFGESSRSIIGSWTTPTVSEGGTPRINMSALCVQFRA
jgi:hypothetical protein